MLYICCVFGGCFDVSFLELIPDFTRIDSITILVVIAVFVFVYLKIRKSKLQNNTAVISTQSYTELDVLMQPKKPVFKKDKPPFSQFSPKSLYLWFLIAVALIWIVGYLYNIEIK
jgi:Ca2+/Na+ antiporter